MFRNVQCDHVKKGALDENSLSKQHVNVAQGTSSNLYPHMHMEKYTAPNDSDQIASQG